MTDAERTAQARQYAQIKRALWVGGLVVTLGVCWVLVHGGWSATWATWAEATWASRGGSVALYGVLFGGLLYAVGLPLQFYGGFVLEHQFQLSNQTLVQWLQREAKQLLLGGLLGLIFLEALYVCIDVGQHWWWLLLALGWWMISVVIVRILPTVIIPLFYKCTPLKDGTLRQTLVGLSERVRVPIMNAFCIDLSRDTKKANAAVVGWGKTRRVLMADTLLERFTPEEITSVVAHELGHHRYHHISLHLVISLCTTLIGFWILASTSGWWASTGVADLQWLPGLIMGLTLLNVCFMPIENGLSRLMERQADGFALEVTQAPQPFISTMRKLAEQNLAEMQPPRWVEWWFYSHPAIWRRVAMGESFAYQEARRARTA